MADISSAPLVNYINGFASGRIDSERREEVEFTWGQMVSVDAGAVNAGATITASMTSQAAGYQINASITWFVTVTPAVTGNGNTPTAACVLPQTNRPFPFTGLQLLVANYGANPINCFAHPNDTGNSINSLAANASVVLGPNTITPFQCLTPGIWNAVDIGGGFNGSIETVVSQGTITAAGAAQGTSTPIVQAMTNVVSTGNNQGVSLPPAKAGSQITVNGAGGGGATNLNIYPVIGGTDAINALGANAAFAQAVPATSPTIFFCFVNGTWTTK